MKVVISDQHWENLEPERAALAGVADLTAFSDWPGTEAFLAEASDADGVLTVVAPFTAEVLDGLKRCRVIVRYGVGVDTVDLDAATRLGIPVSNCPDYCTDDVADHTVMLMLSLLRKLPAAMDWLRSGGWGHAELRPIRRLSSYTLGIAGFGRIAREVAARAQAFGMRVVAFDPYVPHGVFANAGVPAVDLDELLARSDILALHMPLTAETRHLLREETLRRLRPGAFVVNTARGGLIHTGDLLDALESGRVAGAALDVLEDEPIPPDHRLVRHPRAIVTGHLAWYSEEALRQLQRLVAEECARVLRGEEPRYCVNPDYRAAGAGRAAPR